MVNDLGDNGQDKGMDLPASIGQYTAESAPEVIPHYSAPFHTDRRVEIHCRQIGGSAANLQWFKLFRGDGKPDQPANDALLPKIWETVEGKKPTPTAWIKVGEFNVPSVGSATYYGCNYAEHRGRGTTRGGWGKCNSVQVRHQSYSNGVVMRCAYEDSTSHRDFNDHVVEIAFIYI